MTPFLKLQKITDITKKYFTRQQLIFVQYRGLLSYYAVPEAGDREQKISLSYKRSFNTRSSVNINATYAMQDFNDDVYLLNRNVVSQNSKGFIQTSLILSQSIKSNIGASVEFSKKVNFAYHFENTNLALDINSPILDEFTWDGFWSKAKMTWRLPSFNKLLSSFGYYYKEYPLVNVYQYTFEEMGYSLNEDGSRIVLHPSRQDKGIYINITWNKEWFLPINDFFKSIESLVEAGWKRNSSNNILYDTEGFSYSIGLSVTY